MTANTTPTQATPATVSANELHEMARSLLSASQSRKHDANVALWADTYGARLIATAREYQRLREAAAHFLVVGDGYDDDGDAYYASRARLDALLPALSPDPADERGAQSGAGQEGDK